MYHVTKELQDAVKIMKSIFDRECTLSEILTMRRTIITSLDSNSRTRDIVNKTNPSLDAVLVILRDYYDFDFYDLWYRKERELLVDINKIGIGLFSSSIGKDGNSFDIDPRFIEYFRRV